MARRETDESGEAFDGDRAVIRHVRGDGLSHRYNLIGFCCVAHFLK
jgi:hypothetical protein